VKALDGVSLELREGELLGLLGPNGAGKTTLVRAIAGRVRLDAGTITIDSGALGVVPQEIALYPALTARENLEAFGELNGLRGPTLRERVGWALEWTALAERTKDPVRTFSGGMRRRLNIACGILHRPRVILLDEPTVGVDPQSRERIHDMLDALRADGHTLLLTTHQLDEAEARCSRIVIVDHGRVIADGEPAELIRTIGGSFWQHRIDEHARAEFESGHPGQAWDDAHIPVEILHPRVFGGRSSDGVVKIGIV